MWGLIDGLRHNSRLLKWSLHVFWGLISYEFREIWRSNTEVSHQHWTPHIHVQLTHVMKRRPAQVIRLLKYSQHVLICHLPSIQEVSWQISCSLREVCPVTSCFHTSTCRLPVPLFWAVTSMWADGVQNMTRSEPCLTQTWCGINEWEWGGCRGTGLQSCHTAGNEPHWTTHFKYTQTQYPIMPGVRLESLCCNTQNVSLNTDCMAVKNVTNIPFWKSQMMICTQPGVQSSSWITEQMSKADQTLIFTVFNPPHWVIQAYVRQLQANICIMLMCSEQSQHTWMMDQECYTWNRCCGATVRTISAQGQLRKFDWVCVQRLVKRHRNNNNIITGTNEPFPVPKITRKQNVGGHIWFDWLKTSWQTTNRCVCALSDGVRVAFILSHVDSAKI